MEADPAVRRGDPVGPRLPPDGDHAVDRARVNVGPVSEDDDRRVDLLAERVETAAQRRSRTALPVRAVHDPCMDLDVVCAEDDNDVVHRARAHPLEDSRQKNMLLWCPESG